MPSITAESISWEAERTELHTVLQAPIFVRSPALSHLLSYLCEKTFAGETNEIKEYSIALDVFDRRDSFAQDTDSIVRVEANRLRKRLSEYYARDGAADPRSHHNSRGAVCAEVSACGSAGKRRY